MTAVLDVLEFPSYEERYFPGMRTISENSWGAQIRDDEVIVERQMNTLPLRIPKGLEQRTEQVDDIFEDKLFDETITYFPPVRAKVLPFPINESVVEEPVIEEVQDWSTKTFYGTVPKFVEELRKEKKLEEKLAAKEKLDYWKEEQPFLYKTTFETPAWLENLTPETKRVVNFTHLIAEAAGYSQDDRFALVKAAANRDNEAVSGYAEAVITVYQTLKAGEKSAEPPVLETLQTKAAATLGEGTGTDACIRDAQLIYLADRYESVAQEHLKAYQRVSGEEKDLLGKEGSPLYMAMETMEGENKYLSRHDEEQVRALRKGVESLLKM